MTKNQNQDKGKVIPFPGLKERYFEKGLAYLDAHKFEEAIEMLSQARYLDPEDSQIAAVYLAALYENGDYTESQDIAEELLHKGIGNYFDILDIYLMILIQLNNFKKIINTLEPLFDENEVPPDKAEHFLSLLQLSKKAEANKKIIDQDKNDFIINKEKPLEEQLFQISTLKDKNIYPYLHSLEILLVDEQAHPLIKTIVINLLRENRVDQEINVKKMGREGNFIPTQLPLADEMPLSRKIMKQLSSHLDDHNPILLNQIFDMIQRHSFLLYPFEVEPNDSNIWAAAYRGMGYEVYGEPWDKLTLAETFGVNIDDLEKALALINELEQILIANV